MNDWKMKSPLGGLVSGVVYLFSRVQDAAPVLGDHIAIFGAGTVGALTAALLAPRFEASHTSHEGLRSGEP